MAASEPIRDLEKIEKMKNHLLRQNVMHYTMFIMGMNIGLRISDLLSIRWVDVLESDKKTFKVLRIKESKTDKQRVIKLNKPCLAALSLLMKELDKIDLSHYIFKSKELNSKHLNEKSFYEEINRVISLTEFKKHMDKNGVDIDTSVMIDQNNIFELRNEHILKYYKSELKETYLLILLTVLELNQTTNVFDMKVEELSIEKFSTQLYKAINKHCNDSYKTNIKKEHYIFKEYKGVTKPINRHHAGRILRESAEQVGIKDKIGTHTMRKCLGYWAWKGTPNGEPQPLAVIMEVLNHSSLKETKRYLGISQDDLYNFYDNMNL